MVKILRATHEGVLEIGDASLEVAILEDGTRIITQAAVFKALDRPSRGNARVIGIPVFMDAKNLQPFISAELRDVINRIEYINLSGKTQLGYNANILPLVSDLYLIARENGVIVNPNQLETAHKAEILVRSLSKVGMTALVDEATGYQYDREKDALQKILRAYISEELLAWQKTFPDVYYKELFRLNGWDFTVKGINKRPGVIGTWTNKLIYEQLPPGVLDELKKKTPKSSKGNRTSRYFQYLTDDFGSPHLKEQISKTITLFQLSDNMNHMWQQLEKLKERQDGIIQLELPFEFDEKGRTIEPPVEEPEQLSYFNKNLKKALEYKEPAST